MCKVINAEDIISTARHLLEAAYMAASSLSDREEADALTTVLDEASKKLVAARNLLDEYRAERNAA